MKKLTLAILFVVASATQALAEPPTTKNLRAAFENAKANHRAEMKAIQLEAVLMSDLNSKRDGQGDREAVAEAAKQAPAKTRQQ
jgi:hypothetical protein